MLLFIGPMTKDDLNALACVYYSALLKNLIHQETLITDVMLLYWRWQSLTKHEVLILGLMNGNMCGQKSWNPAASETKIVPLTGLDFKEIIRF